MPKGVLERAVHQAFAGEPEGTRVTTVLLLSSHDYVLRRVKIFLGDDPNTSQGTMGKPVTQPYHIQGLIDSLTRTLAMQLQMRFDVPYNKLATTARGLAMYLWVFMQYRDEPPEEVPGPRKRRKLGSAGVEFRHAVPTVDVLGRWMMKP